MELFKVLMQIYTGIAALNIFLGIILWRVTKYRPSLYFTIYWCGLLLDAFAEGAGAQLDPYLRAIFFTPHKLLVHYFLVMVPAEMLKISLPWKKLLPIPILAIVLIYIVKLFSGAPEFLPLPTIAFSSLLYFYVSYQAIRFHRQHLTYGLWAICVLFILFGIHMWDYAYFYVRVDLFIVGFSLAIMFLIAISILVPIALIEKISMEKARLETDVLYRAGLFQASKLAVLGEMAGGVAHEINNPLTVLLLNLERMLETARQSANPELFQGKIQQCIKYVERMSHIVQGLLTFSRQDKLQELRVTTVAELIADTTLFFTEKLESHGVQLKILIPNDSVVVSVRPMQISQVLVNLVNNAYDAVLMRSEKWIRIEAVVVGRDLEISVTDSGEGLAEEMQDKIFQPFFTTKEIGKGTGLGLSVSKGIVDSHMGKIYLDTSSKNTRFVVRLPLTLQSNKN